MTQCRLHTALYIALLATLAAAPARAETWVDYQADSGVFKCRLPKEHSTVSSLLITADKAAIASEETTAVIDERPARNDMKSYVVKMDQTFGPALSEDEKTLVLDHEVGLYTDFYKETYDGVVKETKSDPILGQWGREIHMSYQDPTWGPLDVRVHVMVTDDTRIEQVLVTPEDIIDSYTSRDFFDSLYYNNRPIKIEDLLKDKWHPLQSPYRIFTVQVPEVMHGFFPTKPVVKHSPKSEIVTLLFKDPVREQSLFYNIYSYKFSQDLTYDDIQTVLTHNHILKLGADPRGMKFRNLLDNEGVRTLETSYHIKTLPDFPYLETAHIKATIKRDTMVVQEIIGSRVLATSPFANSLMKLVDFHPELYIANPIDEPDAAAAAPRAKAIMPLQAPRKDVEIEVPTPTAEPLEGSLHHDIIDTVKKDHAKPLIGPDPADAGATEPDTKAATPDAPGATAVPSKATPSTPAPPAQAAPSPAPATP